MSREKQTRLFIMLAVLLMVTVGVRFGIVSWYNRKAPEWTEIPGPSIAQAAAGQSAGVALTSNLLKSTALPVPHSTSPTVGSSANTNTHGDISTTYNNSGHNQPETPSPTITVTAPPMSTAYPASETASLATVGNIASAASCSLNDSPPKLDINTATITDLDGLPGIGNTIATAILAERQRRGGFNQLEDLLEVNGIGQVRFSRLAPLLCISPATAA